MFVFLPAVVVVVVVLDKCTPLLCNQNVNSVVLITTLSRTVYSPRNTGLERYQGPLGVHTH